MPKSALVAGGTGLVGNHLVNLLVRSGEFDVVKVLVRKGSSFFRAGVNTIEVDYNHLMDYHEAIKADVVFCCLGTTIAKAGSKDEFRKVDFNYPLDLAKICLKNGCLQYNIITASGANSNSLFFYSRVKGDVETSIKNLGLSSVNIFRPSLLLGTRKEKRLGEIAGAAMAKIINPIMIGSLRKYRAIKAEVVAKAMMHCAMKEIPGIQVIESDMIQELSEEYDGY